MRKKEKYETIFPMLWYIVGIESASPLPIDFDLLTLSESSCIENVEAQERTTGLM